MGPFQFIGLRVSTVLANQKPRNPPRSMGNLVHIPNMDSCINALTTTYLFGQAITGQYHGGNVTEYMDLIFMCKSTVYTLCNELILIQETRYCWEGDVPKTTLTSRFLTPFLIWTIKFIETWRG